MTTPYLKNKYLETTKKLVAEGIFPNVMACPKIVKVTLNVGIGKYRKEDRKIESILHDIEKIAGQKAVITKAKKSIAGFSIRKGEKVGIKVTLRKNRMYNFLWTLFNIALPRTRDFKGISLKNVDQRGNLTIGIKEHTVFPEIKGDEVKQLFGLEVCITIDGNCKREEAILLYKELGFPLIFETTPIKKQTK